MKKLGKILLKILKWILILLVLIIVLFFAVRFVGQTINRQTPEVEFTAIKRTHDGRYQAVADEGENGFTAEKAATFLTSVYEPVITPAP